jgi:hypothetical protein
MLKDTNSDLICEGHKTGLNESPVSDF